MNEYRHLISGKSGAQPFFDFAACLRNHNGGEKNKKTQKNKLATTFSFYEKDMAKWREKLGLASQPIKPLSPYKILDVDAKGNTGTVKFFISIF